ncbi:hypothetical protein Tco_1462041 [Tanacetum coccineum]
MLHNQPHHSHVTLNSGSDRVHSDSGHQKFCSVPKQLLYYYIISASITSVHLAMRSSNSLGAASICLDDPVPSIDDLCDYIL